MHAHEYRLLGASCLILKHVPQRTSYLVITVSLSRFWDQNFHQNRNTQFHVGENPEVPGIKRWVDFFYACVTQPVQQADS